MRVRSFAWTLHPRSVFRTSRGSNSEGVNVFLQLADGQGNTGMGEASPRGYYKENAALVLEKLHRAEGFIRDLRVESVEDIRRVWAESWPLLAPSRAAQCAFDVALWDLLARRERIPAAELAWGVLPREVRSFCTIGLSEPDELTAKIEEVRRNDLVKIKMDRGGDTAAITRLRSCSAARIAVDANCAWRETDVPGFASELAALEVLFIEQPMDPSEDAGMSAVLSRSPLPILADESCVTAGDVDRMPGRFSGFSIKLVKCGGITPALDMARRGRELGLTVMVGCMLESSLLVAAGAVIGQGTDYADLDGAWLLADDPFTGLSFERGCLRVPDSPGLGVAPSAEFVRRNGLEYEKSVRSPH